MTTTVPRTAYHSAHKPPIAGIQPVERFDTAGAYSRRLSAFVHDASIGALPPEYLACDIIVADVPWQRGFDEFARRAGMPAATFPSFMTGVSNIIKGSVGAACPTYLITGRHALNYLPPPDVILPMRLNQDDAIAIGYRPGAETFADYGDSREFIHALTRHYERIGDFCCGYGRSGRIFLRNGKSAVLSDINPQCIGYIAGATRGWLS
jgi:hypothetical protein